MTITNAETSTNVHEIAPSVFRISTPVQFPNGDTFTFNQILIVDDAPLLFHTGPRKMFPLVQQAVAHVLGDVEKLRYLGFSHVEADECGSLNDWLAASPQAEVVFGELGVMVSVGDLADRPPRALKDGEELSLGKKTVVWLDAPHLPHNWECGYLFEKTSRTLLCGDLFSHMGNGAAITESEVLGPSEAMRKGTGGVAIEKNTRVLLEKLARTEATTLAIMHGSAYRGDGRAHLLAMADALGV